MNHRLGRLLALVMLFGTGVRADVRLPHIFGSHMVLQRDMELPVWGWADAGEEVTVQLGDQAAVKATAGADGLWRVKLPKQSAGGAACTLTISGKNKLALEDVLIGEVWVCSGQSNMEMVVASSKDAPAEIAAADFPAIRQVVVPKKPTPLPADDFDGEWQVCSPATAGRFTAAGFFMARELYKELKVPIGLVNTSWGGTAIEPWTTPSGFAQVEALKNLQQQVALADPRSPEHKARLEQYLDALAVWQAKAKEALVKDQLLEGAPAYPGELLPLTTHTQPTTLYNGMVAPLVPLAFRGAIWYQGETNHREGKLYTEKMKALIGGWRTTWGGQEFPFYYVQIAPYRYGDEPSYYMPQFWEAQAAALAIPNTGMVVTNDIGDINDIHPKNKQEVGRRLALLALNGTYGRKDVVANGPTVKSLSIEGNKLRIRFDNVGGGLASRDGQPLNWFQLIGKGNYDFVPAEAVIDGDSVLVSAADVKEPTAVRFGWHRNAEMNLMNKEGLPARAFQAGEVPNRDWLTMKVPEAREFVTVYDLDLARLGADIKYDADNRAQITKPFDRVAYFLEVQKEGQQEPDYVYVSMDPFTNDLAKIGIPTLASGVKFQLRVNNMTVASNVAGIATGTGLQGNLEFWPHNYGPLNSAGVPNASAELWDFGDQPSDPADGYGSMQVGNFNAKQTVFAINNWKAGPNADIGIGNSEGRTRDWTFSGNASSYKVKRLRVLVHTKD